MARKHKEEKAREAAPQEEKREQKALTAWEEPFAELREWWPFGRGFPALERWLREEDWPMGGRWMPALDLHETEGEYAVTVELPGASKDDVTVELENGVLTIRGEKKSEREEKKEQRRLVERRYGAFSRSFSLPRDADGDHIEARFEDGVLTLTIPRTEAAKSRTVAIK